MLDSLFNEAFLSKELIIRRNAVLARLLSLSCQNEEDYEKNRNINRMVGLGDWRFGTELDGMVIIMIIGLAVLILTFFVTKLTGEITVLRNKSTGG